MLATVETAPATSVAAHKFFVLDIASLSSPPSLALL
jgi:hypothetical protein